MKGLNMMTFVLIIVAFVIGGKAQEAGGIQNLLNKKKEGDKKDEAPKETVKYSGK